MSAQKLGAAGCVRVAFLGAAIALMGAIQCERVNHMKPPEKPKPEKREEPEEDKRPRIIPGQRQRPIALVGLHRDQGPWDQKPMGVIH